MSLEAISWALVQAPDVPPQCVSLLIGLANHADSQGRGAYAGQKLLAGYARKSDRSVRNDLAVLIERGILRLGDQSLAAHIPADCRPVVYDLAMERKHTSGRKLSSARQQASAATSDRLTEPSSADLQEQKGSGSVLPAGNGLPAGSVVQRERKQASDKPTTNQNQNSPSESSKGGAGGNDPDPLFGEKTPKPRRTRGRAPKAEVGPEFEAWYAAYPVHKARGEAERAWVEEVVKGGADPEVLTEAAKRYRDDPVVRRGWGKHPATWLRAKCWLDEPTESPPPDAGANGGKRVNYTEEEYASGW